MIVHLLLLTDHDGFEVRGDGPDWDGLFWAVFFISGITRTQVVDVIVGRYRFSRGHFVRVFIRGAFGSCSFEGGNKYLVFSLFLSSRCTFRKGTVGVSRSLHIHSLQSGRYKYVYTCIYIVTVLHGRCNYLAGSTLSLNYSDATYEPHSYRPVP